MSSGVTRNPWFSWAEWNHVRSLVLNRQPEALDYFSVWKSRCSRLPAGVETTYSLMEVVGQESSNLALAMAINRFINLVSHIGMNVWGVSKLHMAADRLGVPLWIVDLRHESTHGHMPNSLTLRAGYEVCWSWICTNYWKTKRKDVFWDDGPDEKKLADLLELYLYLKVYSIWGTPAVNDIAESSDVFSHLKRLWTCSTSPKQRQEFTRMTVKQALGLVKNEIQKLDVDPELLARTLVDQDLLVPDLAFLESLLPDQEEDHVEIPSDLITVWKEFIEKIHEKVGGKALIGLLVNKICRESVDEQIKEYCAAWVVELSEGLQGRSKILNIGNNSNVDLSDVESWISQPNRLVQMMLPCFTSLVGLDKEKENLLDQLITAAINEEPAVEEATKIHTLEDLGGETMEVESQESVPKRGWRKEAPSDWGDQIFKTFPGQTWESLWLNSATEWHYSESQDLEEESVPEFECAKVIWPGHKSNPRTEEDEDEEENKAIPAFYKNTAPSPSKPRSHRSPRRKRPKKA